MNRSIVTMIFFNRIRLRICMYIEEAYIDKNLNNSFEEIKLIEEEFH